MSYKELQEMAMEHYNNGGDVVVECWDVREFNNYVAQFGRITKAIALDLFKFYKEIQCEF